MNDDDFLSVPILLNNLFTFKNKVLHMSHWANSGILYVKDLFKPDGSMLSEREILQKLSVKVREYFIFKTVFSDLSESFNTNKSPFITIRSYWTCLVNNSLRSLKTQKSTHTCQKEIYLQLYARCVGKRLQNDQSTLAFNL